MKKHNRFAGRALSLLCALCFLALLPAGCTPAEETPDGPVLTVDGRSFAVESRNALSGVSLLDRGYRSEDGSPSAVCILPQDGAVAYFSFVLTDGAAEFTSECVACAAGERVYIPTNGCLVYLPGEACTGEPTLEGYAPDTEGYIDLTAGACVTDESGRTGFALTHKSVDSLEEGMTGVLMSAGDPELALSAPYVGMKVKRGSRESFRITEWDVQKSGRDAFTLILRDEYALACARGFYDGGDAIYFLNTNTITKYGDSMVLEIGGNAYRVDALNPSEAQSGISVYDENSGLLVSPDGGSSFMDVLIFDGVVTQTGAAGERTVFPYPNGYLVRFSGEEQVEAAGRIRVGDKAEAVGFTPETSPRQYVELDGRFKVEIAYHNESRTGTARAVLYDGNFAHDSTQTNIWGMEVAVGADGRVQAVVPMGTEGVSGDTEIPEGGFVLSAGYALYRSYFERLEAGCTAEYVEKDGVYFF